MFGDLLSSRLIQAGIAFFVVVVGGSLLYSWHVHRATESDMARHDQLLRGRDKQNETRPAAAVNDPTENEAPLKQGPDTADAPATVGDPSQTRADMSQESSVSATGVSDMEADIIAEEEKAEEALSAEERQEREFRKRFKEIFKEIEAIVAAAGGKITPESHPEEMQKIARLQKEMLQMMLAGNEDPAVRDLIAVTDAQQRFQSRLKADGEIPVSEAFKMADFIETELGNERGAAGIRTLAQIAIDNGSDVITQEHFDAEYVQK